MVNSTELKNQIDDIRTNAFIAIKNILQDNTGDYTEFNTPIKFTHIGCPALIRSINISANKIKVGSVCGAYHGAFSLNELDTETYISILEELEKNVHTFPENNEE